jgi:hypothetical protein
MFVMIWPRISLKILLAIMIIVAVRNFCRFPHDATALNWTEVFMLSR